jgi:dethiobiotin synthetase
VRELAASADVVLVEGAGGLLVRLDGRGGTLADLGSALRYLGTSCGAVLVAAPGLGTLSTSALTAEALAARSIPLLGVVVGSWPADPDLAETENLVDLPRVTGAPLWGRIPHGAGRLPDGEFAAAAPTWFDIS